MNYSLRWTEEAKKSFNQNLEYLSDEWDNEVINNFLDRVDGILSQIKATLRYIHYIARRITFANA